MEPSESGHSLFQRFAKFAAAASVLGLALLQLWLGWGWYRQNYAAMHAYHLDGLPAILLLSLAIATLATPFFAFQMSQTPGDAPQNALQTLQLYGSVLGIITAAFSLILFLLWILGWVRVLLYVLYRMCVDWIL